MYLEVYKKFKEDGVNISKPLVGLVRSRYTKIIKCLLEAGADPNYRDQEFPHKTPLIIACIHGYKKIVKLLLIHGANPELEDMHGSTAITSTNNLEIIKILLEYNAKPNSGRRKVFLSSKITAETAIHMAAKKNRKDIIKLLHEYGGDIELRSDDQTPLMLACQEGHLGAVLCLLELGADKHQKTLDGFEALDYAKIYEYKEIMKLLEVY